MLGITGAFSNIEISERTASQDTTRRTLKLPKNRSTLSLPNLSTDRIQISPSLIRNNLSDIICDDDSGDQPIDFSKKYCETKLNPEPKPEKSSRNCSFNSFTMYAETDLDQPTDYSLRYAEDDSDSDQCNKISKTETTEFVQDTVKTYCTEDTPYETPFNFSTSTSMSDLRIENKMDVKTANKEEGNEGQSKIKSEFSSGLMSPEKPVNYCEEGTPGYFSRVASCGSLNSIPKQEVKENVEDEEKGKVVRRVSKFSGESKAVKFEDVVNYAEETPLMFSRSSSLASLDSIEQHSIHDDRSSIVSDFSRLTSGLISPSELPDSPSQTVPPSPKSRQKPLVFPSPLPKKKPDDLSETVEALPKSSVFEDVVKKFKMESTPLHFSAATSLSSLLDPDDEKHEDVIKNEIVDDLNALDINNDLSDNSEDEDILAACINIGIQSNKYCQTKPKTPPPPTNEVNIVGDSLRTYCTEDTPAVLSHAGSNSDLSLLSIPTKSNNVLVEDDELCDKEETEEAPEKSNQEQIDASNSSRRSSFSSSISDQDGEALLKECILAGIPAKVEAKVESEDSDDEDILKKCINLGMQNNRYTQRKQEDTVRSYYTEDTPAILSHAGSNSNLSILSLNGTDNCFSESDEEEECVQYGMAQNANKSVPNQEEELSDSDSDSSLLRQCIQAGIPQKSRRPQDASFDLTPAEKALLQQCILDGMNKCRSVSRKSEEDNTELTEGEQALLRQCILSGMPKNKNLTQGGPSRSKESAELSESERALLQQCILAGMPKSQKKTSTGRQWMKRSKEERVEPEHTCCVHCPRNNQKGKQVKSKKKKEKGHGQIRESRDVNVLYITSQILAMRREVVERVREEWV